MTFVLDSVRPLPIQHCQCFNGHGFDVMDGSSAGVWVATFHDHGKLMASFAVNAAWRAKMAAGSPYPGGMSPVVVVNGPTHPPTPWVNVGSNGHVSSNPMEPPSAPTYHKVLVHGKREYRIGTCADCGRENTALTKYKGKRLTSSGCCSGCIAALASEAAEAESQLYMARSGGRIEERKTENVYRELASALAKVVP